MQDEIRALMRGWSLEATLPREADIEALKDSLGAGTRVYLSAPANLSEDRMVASAVAVREAGLEPVPHVTTRGMASAAAAERMLKRLNGEAGVTRALVIAGDRDAVAGPYPGAIDLIRSGLLQASGIAEIGISGYPDGHPQIHDHIIAAAMPTKVEAARAAGLDVHVVTQFCFEPERISEWLGLWRPVVPGVPVRVGFAGPTSATALMKFAMRCGVRASARGLMRGGLAMIGSLVGDTSPEALIGEIARDWAAPEGAPVTVHLYSFGGIGRTAAWGQALAKGTSGG